MSSYINLKNYTVPFEINGCRMQMLVKAASADEAKEVVKESIVFYQVIRSEFRYRAAAVLSRGAQKFADKLKSFINKAN